MKSVGVMGDYRTYENVVALRSVDTQDFMTADWSHLPYELLGRAANRIVNEVRGINRVVYDITSKPPGTIEVGSSRPPRPRSGPFSFHARRVVEAFGGAESSLRPATDVRRKPARHEISLRAHVDPIRSHSRNQRPRRRRRPSWRRSS